MDEREEQKQDTESQEDVGGQGFRAGRGEAEEDVEGHTVRGHSREGEDDSGEDEGRSKGRLTGSDAGLKREIRTVDSL